MLNRIAITHLQQWLTSYNRKPLVIRGARQVGKTTLVRMFAKEAGLELIEINMEKPWQFKSIVPLLNPKKVIEAIEFEFNVDIIPQKSLIFFDEVQAFPEFFPLLRYFYDETPEYPMIITGSLLEFVLNEPSFSMPVGRIDFLYLFPLTFEEFLEGIEEEKILNWIKNYKLGMDVYENIHKKCNSLVKTYTIVGGMPEAVYAYKETKSLREVEKIKAGIIDTFRLDFNKYHKKADPRLLTHVFDKVPELLGKKIIYSHVDPNSRSDDVAKAIQQLCLARIIAKIFHSSANGIPLSAEKKDNIFKLMCIDIGLLLTQLKLNPIEIETSLELNLINQGVLSEQFIALHLFQSSPYYMEPELFYWVREKKASSAEVDFIYQHNENIIPIEVKAGKTGSLRSLQLLVLEKGLKKAVRFNSDFPNIFKEDKKTMKGNVSFELISLPHYLVQRLPGFLNQ